MRVPLAAAKRSTTRITIQQQIRTTSRKRLGDRSNDSVDSYCYIGLTTEKDGDSFLICGLSLLDCLYYAIHVLYLMAWRGKKAREREANSSDEVGQNRKGDGSNIYVE